MLLVILGTREKDDSMMWLMVGEGRVKMMMMTRRTTPRSLMERRGMIRPMWRMQRLLVNTLWVMMMCENEMDWERSCDHGMVRGLEGGVG